MWIDDRIKRLIGGWYHTKLLVEETMVIAKAEEMKEIMDKLEVINNLRVDLNIYCDKLKNKKNTATNGI